jgi:hypothetical protein
LENWQRDFLNTLQQRNKWYVEKNNLKKGDLVIIKEDNVAVCNWPLGRVVNIFPGKDFKVRVAEIKTSRGIFKRPISKLCILPFEN